MLAQSYSLDIFIFKVYCLEVDKVYIGGEIGAGHFLGISIHLCVAPSQHSVPITFLPSLLFLEPLFLTPQPLP